MITIQNLQVEDAKAREICMKHINKQILSGIGYFIDMCDEDAEYKKTFLNDIGYADLFPKGFQGDRYAELCYIKDIVEGGIVYNLSPSQKYVLMSCLASYYEDNEDEYTLEFADKVFKTEVLRASMSPMSKIFEQGEISLNVIPIEDMHERFYVLSKMAETIHNFLKDNPEEDTEGAFGSILESYMGDVENLMNYASVCFDDEDYELLGEATREELLADPASAQLGLDV